MQKPMNKPNPDGFSVAPDHRQISFGVQHALSALLTASIVYGTVVIFAALLSRAGTDDHICLAFVHAGGALALALFWKMGRWGTARYDSFGAALLLLGVAFRVHALIDALFYGTRIEALYRYPNLPIPTNQFDLLLKGELITVLALLLIACTWRLKIGNYVERHSFLRNANGSPLKISILIYGSAVAVDIARRVAGISFGPLEQILSLLFAVGIAAIYFIAQQQRKITRRVMYAFILGLPLSILALDSGMKEQIFFPFIPAAILFWNNYRQGLIRVTAISIAATLLAISQLYVHHVRAVSWNDDGDLDVPTMEIISSFMDDFKDVRIVDAFDRMSSRANMTSTHATTVMLADHYGHEPVEVFGLIPASLVPRIFWPGKPVMQPGVMHTARILGYTGSITEIRSATAAGFATELYLGGWWIGVVIGAISYGWLMAAVQNWALCFGPGFTHLSFCFVAFYWTIRFDEKHVVYAYTSVIFLTIFSWMLAKATRAFHIQGITRYSPLNR